ncbi:MAG: preprotein translocase subunit SecA [Planctomycetes bacterium]|nr:preprotein translocase subunit SecA [Planctomycetota bacterium]
MGLFEFVEKGMNLFLGSRDKRFRKQVQPTIDRINSLESQFSALSEDELKAKTIEFRERYKKAAQSGGDRQSALDAILPEAFAAVRESAKRRLGQRHYDVQLIGGIALHSGKIAEMATGEGKTLVATLPAYLNAIPGRDPKTGLRLGVHVITVNDYLAKRDRDWMAPVFETLGLTVGCIQSYMSNQERQPEYDSDITYGTNNEFGFDYLRDNMKTDVRDQVQQKLFYAIVDEVDSALIDEARTPLIIAGPSKDSGRNYALAHEISGRLDRYDTFRIKTDEGSGFKLRCASDWDKNRGMYLAKTASRFEGTIKVPRALVKENRSYVEEGVDTLSLTLTSGVALVGWKEDITDSHFALKPQSVEIPHDAVEEYTEKDCHVDDEHNAAYLNESGTRIVEKALGIDSIHDGIHVEWPHLICQALRARFTYFRDVHYVVEGEGVEQEVVIVDISRGRKMPGRRWSDGLHQAVEAKEGIKIKEETQTLATVTFQNFFRMYEKLSGMTGTAATEAKEFEEIYFLEVLSIPTNRPIARLDAMDAVYGTHEDKIAALVSEIEKNFNVGRPVLVGTTSIEKSEVLSKLLQRQGIPHEVLNAKHHEREAEIVAKAGQLGQITIATNMAGRGTDIVLGTFTEEELVKHWKRTGLLPHKFDSELTDDTQGNSLAKALCENLMPKELSGELKETSERWTALEKFCREWDYPKIHVCTSVKQLGGLAVLGSERHESRRIDNQLRGRSGRQGDPGYSRFFLSLEDDLLRMFASDSIRGFMQKTGFEKGARLESRLLSRMIKKAQEKVEGMHFDSRKNLLEYDVVMDTQRKSVYGLRQQILESRDIRELAIAKIGEAIADKVFEYYDPDSLESYNEETRGAAELDVDKFIDWFHRCFAPLIPNPDDPKKVDRETVVTAADLKGKSVEQATSRTQEIAHSLYERREKELWERCVHERREAIRYFTGMFTFERDNLPASAWERDKLIKWCKDGFAFEASEDMVSGNDRQTIVERLTSAIEEHVISEGAPTVEFGLAANVNPMRGIERFLILSSIDGKWKDHLQQIDILRSHIRYEGYAQKDPKQVFKKEGFDMFQKMLAGVDEQIATNIMHLNIRGTDYRALERRWGMQSVSRSNAAGGDDALAQDRELRAQQQAAIEASKRQSAGGGPKQAPKRKSPPKKSDEPPPWLQKK